MAKIKGQLEYQKFLNGDQLTRKQAILAQCYTCNGEKESVVDCQGHSCPLYQFSHHKNKQRASLPPHEEIIENRGLNAHKTATYSAKLASVPSPEHMQN